MPKAEVVELIRPLCLFDPQTLQEQALGKAATEIIRSIRAADGTREAFIIRETGDVVDIETCRDLGKVSEVERRLAQQLEGITTSHKKVKKRKEQLEGQFCLFEEPPDAQQPRA